MRWLNDPAKFPELTYSDVFLVPGYSDVGSRTNVDLTPSDHIGTSLPIVVANMNAVSGRRMAETIARRGGLVILPQDIPGEILAKTVSQIKASHQLYDTPITLSPDDTVQVAMSLIYKRSNGA